jgi:hypothetical protein
MATVTLTQTDSPSRSKQGGPCWIAIGSVYATTAGRELDAEAGDTITVNGKCSLRRASGKVDVRRDSWSVIVTGDEADTVTVSLGSPQAVSATISGVREA